MSGTRNVITRNRGTATAGNIIVVLDSQSNAWSIDISNAANLWQSYPATTGGIDMIAVGDTSGNNTGWRLFGLKKPNPSLYWHRPLSDHSSPWIQGNHGFADSPREMTSISFGGSSDQFVFGVLTDGNYAVTHFPSGDWWKNWHADMGPQKPTPIMQLVTCASMNYALDANGVVFSQTLWPPGVSQWRRLTQPGGQTVQLVAASKSYVWAYTAQGQLWNMHSGDSTGAWIG
ncbi:hypothetical protein Aspvir_003259 [Aspergillus viridinutans]|uniref:Fucose-specific lectin n=1 Tax=Aspergillus viridinutans TaxID=75553 RepID=A0A9P3C7H8_ASPVI|nr:uncharacterized protein Aspvir_003259 [Aspergillus viridinutans]GIK07593.1 hypothetical protein Aspvir_003259 [Aspergillus viridinutans]